MSDYDANGLHNPYNHDLTGPVDPSLVRDLYAAMVRQHAEDALSEADRNVRRLRAHLADVRRGLVSAMATIDRVLAQ